MDKFSRNAETIRLYREQLKVRLVSKLWSLHPLFCTCKHIAQTTE